MSDPDEKKSEKEIKVSFEDFIREIDFEINKRRKKWSLTAISWMDFEDVAQILRIHIYMKWELYDPQKPLAPWLNRIISNQIKNLIRNNYSNFTRPCLKCSASEGIDFCSIYGKQDNSCPLYAFWEKSKKKAHDVKIPLPLENHSQEIFKSSSEDCDLESNFKRLNKALETHLKPTEWKVYQYLYIENLSEEETAKKMGYRSTEKNRPPGYKQIKNIRKSIIEKTKSLINSGKLDIF